MASRKQAQPNSPRRENDATACPLPQGPKTAPQRGLAIDLRNTNTASGRTGRPYVASNLTFGVSTVGNIPALQLCISSILNGTMVPKKILIRSEGPFPSFCDFYLEQLSELARIRGVEFSFNVMARIGARKGCDWLMDNCNTDLLLMGDDDVIYEMEAISRILDATSVIEKHHGNWGFVVGNKRDVNNRRAYGDFSQSEISPHGLQNWASTNLYYAYEPVEVYPECVALDTGHVALNLRALRFTGLNFACYGEDYNSGGYDSLMGMRCTQAGFKGFFAHQSKSFHLEKQKQNFNEFSQRKSYLAAAARDLKLDPTLIDKVFNWV